MDAGRSNVGNTAGRQSQMIQEIERLSKVTANAGAKFSTLVDRLKPVLRGRESADENKESPEVVTVPLAPHANLIRRAYLQVETISTKIDDILDRLEA